MSDTVPSTRARQACEPCRRKKTKCPGERPVCSFCQRLGQRCSYERSQDLSARVHKFRRSGSHEVVESKDRLHRLESRVEEVFDILNTLATQKTPTPAPLPPARDSVTEGTASHSSVSARASSPLERTTGGARFDAIDCPEPPEELWSVLVDVWKVKFDCQPLSLLDAESLLLLPKQKLRCLRHSFLALTIPFVGSHDFFRDDHGNATRFYKKSARREILSRIADGEASLGILQASCLVALNDIMGSNSITAWMNIGIGVRLAISTLVMSNKYDPTMAISQSARSRCCWSLFSLDRMYGSSLTVPPCLSTEDVLPEFPTSAPCPNDTTESLSQVPLIKDKGVMANYLQLLSIWGIAMQFVQSVKDGGGEEAWTMGSHYHKVTTRLFAFETQFAQTHRFQQARFQDYSFEALERKRSYWAPWLAGQFLFHAVQGLINHPFLHIASRSRRQTFQPPSFLQTSIDQAVLHSSWIIKCIEVCSETGFTINDPFLAHLAAITATIYLFLLNAKDVELAATAKLGIEKCDGFLRRMGDEWPHLRHTIDKLDILQRAAMTNSTIPANPSAPKAQRSLLWELLDYSASTTPSRVPEFASDAVELNVNTRFLSPLNPLSATPTPAVIAQSSEARDNQVMGAQTVEEALWDPGMEPFGFNLFDNEQMADLPKLTVARDLWNFGQL